MARWTPLLLEVGASRNACRISGDLRICRSLLSHGPSPRNVFDWTSIQPLWRADGVYLFFKKNDVVEEHKRNPRNSVQKADVVYHRTRIEQSLKIAILLIFPSKTKLDMQNPKIFLEHKWNPSKLARRSINVQRPGPVHRFQGLFLDPGEQDLTSRDVLNQANDLASSPYLCKK